MNFVWVKRHSDINYDLSICIITQKLINIYKRKTSTHGANIKQTFLETQISINKLHSVSEALTRKCFRSGLQGFVKISLLLAEKINMLGIISPRFSEEFEPTKPLSEKFR